MDVIENRPTSLISQSPRLRSDRGRAAQFAVRAQYAQSHGRGERDRREMRRCRTVHEMSLKQRPMSGNPLGRQSRARRRFDKIRIGRRVDGTVLRGYQVTMICNETLIFVHVPKTGGMSITEALLKCLPRPVYYFLPSAESARAPKDVDIMPGRRHEFLEEAIGLAAGLGITPKRIIACIRNPYEMEVSRFFYLRKGRPWDKGPAQDLAMTNDFVKFAVGSPYHGRTASQIEHYFEVDGKIPPTLRILRHESLDEDFAAAMTDMDLKAVPLPRHNVTRHDRFDRYLTPDAEEAIYKRFQWVFDTGLYDRFTFSD